MTTEPSKEYGSVLGVLTRLLECHDLPDPPPTDPMPLLLNWFNEARASGTYDDFNAMTLATATPGGIPSARIVLCKSIEISPPALVFYSNYESRKAQELGANPRAACVFHWPHAKRQARIDGSVQRVPPAESDEYYRSRPMISRIGAHASRQSTPINSRQTLVSAAIAVARRAALTGSLDRPAHWGGYRLHITSLELWSARQGRLHDRVRWHRDGDGNAIVWRSERLSP